MTMFLAGVLVFLLFPHFLIMLGNCDTGCTFKADIAFLVDASGSVTQPNFNKVLRFIATLVNNSLDIGRNKVRAAMVTFGNGYQIQFPLDQNFTKEGLIKMIHNTQYTGGSTDTHRALMLARVAVLNPRRPSGARKGVPHIAILITDGLSTDPELTKQEAEMTKQQGIELYTVGISNETSYEELEKISSLPTDQHMFEVDHFDQLMDIGYNLSAALCSGLLSKMTSPTPRPDTTTEPSSENHLVYQTPLFNLHMTTANSTEQPTEQPTQTIYASGGAGVGVTALGLSLSVLACLILVFFTMRYKLRKKVEPFDAEKVHILDKK